MSTERPFLRKARLELEELLEDNVRDRLAGTDAYRALALLARLRNALPEEQARVDLPATDVGALVRSCILPNSDELLDVLRSALEGDEEPEGPLLDALIDLDDFVGVLGFIGPPEQGERVVREARSLLAEHRERTPTLARWAAMRGATLSPKAVVALLWQDIAGTDIAQPSGPGPTTSPQVSPGFKRFRLPELPRMAAHTAEGAIAIRAEHGEEIADAYLDPGTGERVLDITLPSKDTPTPATVRLVALRRGTLEALGSEPLNVIEREGRDLYVSLGPDVGPRSVRHRLSARLDLDLAELVFEVRCDEGT